MYIYVSMCGDTYLRVKYMHTYIHTYKRRRLNEHRVRIVTPVLSRERSTSAELVSLLVVVAFVRGRTLLFSRRRLIVSSSHLVHHELVDSHSLACVPSCVACV